MNWKINPCLYCFNSVYQNDITLAIYAWKGFNESINNTDHEASEIDKKEVNEVTVSLQDIGLLDRCDSPKDLHWLLTKLL